MNFRWLLASPEGAFVKDIEAYRWRREHARELREELRPFLDKAYRRSQSAKSAESRYAAVANFRGWLRRLPHEAVEEVKPTHIGCWVASPAT
jgi:hypothetical protein